MDESGTLSTVTSYYTLTACDAGMYKSVTGSGNCTSCPMFSEALSTTSTECACVKGRQRSDPADITMDCDRKLVFTTIPHNTIVSVSSSHLVSGVADLKAYTWLFGLLLYTGCLYAGRYLCVHVLYVMIFNPSPFHPAL